MDQKDIGTIDGKPITQEMLDEYTATFERDWTPSEVKIIPTERSKALRALYDLNIPIYEIVALERIAKQNKQPLRFFIHSLIQRELFANNE